MSPPPSAGQMHLTASGELTQERILAEKERPKSAWAALFNKKKGNVSFLHIAIAETQIMGIFGNN